MAITLFSGKPGSGKSYGVVQNVILPAVAEGRTIVTNLPLSDKFYAEFPDAKVTQFGEKVDEGFWDINKHPRGCIFVIDEAWRYWPTGIKSSNIPEPEKEFFTKHRHVVGDDGKTSEIVLVTQDGSQLCAFIRNLVQTSYVSKKHAALGAKNHYRVDIYDGCATGPEPRLQIVRQLHGKYKSEVYQYYVSHTENQTTFDGGMEVAVDDRGNIFKSGLFKYGLPLALAFFVYGVYHLYSFFTPPVASDTPVAEAPTASAQVAQTLSVASQNREIIKKQLDMDIDVNRLPLSEEWRLTGQINDKFMIFSEVRGDRTIPMQRCSSYSNTGEPFCVIGGYLVTYYSASIPDRPSFTSDAPSIIPDLSSDSDADDKAETQTL